MTSDCWTWTDSNANCLWYSVRILSINETILLQNKVNKIHWYVIRQGYNSSFFAGNDRRCDDLLRRLLRNPPNNTKIAINIRLSKARYLCHEGFKLVGKNVRTCKEGKWRERVEPNCLSKFKWELKIPCYIHNIQRFWTSLTRTRNFNRLYFFVLFVRRLGLQEALRMHWSIDRRTNATKEFNPH